MFLSMDGHLHQQPRFPAGFNTASYEAIRRTIPLARQQGRDEGKAAREVAWEMHPGLPWCWIVDAAEEARCRG